VYFADKINRITMLAALYIQKSEVFADVDAVSEVADLSADGDEHFSFSLLW